MSKICVEIGGFKLGVMLLIVFEISNLQSQINEMKNQIISEVSCLGDKTFLTTTNKLMLLEERNIFKAAQKYFLSPFYASMGV